MFVLCVVFVVNVGRVSLFVCVGFVCVCLGVCGCVCGGCSRSVFSVCVCGCCGCMFCVCLWGRSCVFGVFVKVLCG